MIIILFSGNWIRKQPSNNSFTKIYFIAWLLISLLLLYFSAFGSFIYWIALSAAALIGIHATFHEVFSAILILLYDQINSSSTVEQQQQQQQVDNRV